MRAWYGVLAAGLSLSLPLALLAEARKVRPVPLSDVVFAQDSDDEQEASEEEEEIAEDRTVPQPVARLPAFQRGATRRRLGGAPRPGAAPRPRAARPAAAGGQGIYQRIEKTASGRSSRYGFLNFNRDRLEIGFSIGERAFQDYNESFGYRRAGLDEIKDFRDNALRSSYSIAVKAGKSQAQVDAAAANIEKEYKKRVKEYLAQQGFRMVDGSLVTVDMPALVRKNGTLVQPLAVSLDEVAQKRRYKSPEIIGAALSFVQTAMHYRQPDIVYKGKHTGGVLPPLTAVVVGWGDCDTKTGLLASMLSNWKQMRMVGVSIPKHYLLGVLLIPEKGDLFLEYQGLQYVLLEPAGPAWMPPGRVAESTVAMLNAREGYTLEPFY